MPLKAPQMPCVDLKGASTRPEAGGAKLKEFKRVFTPIAEGDIGG